VIDKEGILFGQDPGVPPLLFMRSAIGFLMTRESGSWFNVSPEG